MRLFVIPWTIACQVPLSMGILQIRILEWVVMPSSLNNIMILSIYVCVCVCAQSCLTLCDRMDCSLPGSIVHGILQATILNWVAISSPRGASQLRDGTCVSCASCIDRDSLPRTTQEASVSIYVRPYIYSDLFQGSLEKRLGSIFSGDA